MLMNDEVSYAFVIPWTLAIYVWVDECLSLSWWVFKFESMS